MTQAEREEVILLVAEAQEAKVRQGKEDVEGKRGDDEGGGDAGQHQRHPPVPLPLPGLSLGVQGKSRIVLKKL